MKPPNPPPLGDRDVVPRVCSRDTAWPNGVICGKPPFLHVDWGEAWGFVCVEHAAELDRRNWIPERQHELGPDCGMPGAVWDEAANRCYVPDDPPSVAHTDQWTDDDEEPDPVGDFERARRQLDTIGGRW